MEWRPVDGYSRYEVSDTGLVRSLWAGHILKPSIRTKRGRPYACTVNLKEGGLKTFRIHRLVLRAFVGPCPAGHEGCHNDGNPLNNTLTNLRWGTRASNLADMAVHGTRTTPPIHRGETHPMATLTDQQVAQIRVWPHSRGSDSHLARLYKTSAQTIRRLRLRLSRA